jgi:hypothetical protein
VKHPVVIAAVIAALLPARASVSHGSRHMRVAKPRKRFGARFGMRVAEVLVTGLGALACASAVQAGDAVRAMPADAFIETLGINTHVNYTDGAYANVHNVADDLAWLGIRYVRDAPPASGNAPLSSYVYLAQRGIKFDFLTYQNITESIELITSLNTAVPGSVTTVEGFNEINNWPVTYGGLTGSAAGLAAQREIYTRVHGSRDLAGVAVYDLTGYETGPVETRANAADYANQHFYPQNGEQPSYEANGDKWLGNAIASVKKFQLPIVMTEFGYFSLPQSGWYMLGVDERTQAKGVLNGYMDAAAAGVKRTYVYELLDEKPDAQKKNNEMHYGLFRNDNSPKPVAHAIRNLTSILRDESLHPANGAADGELAYSLSGMPVSANSLLLQKKDGRFVLVLWNETRIWDRATGTPLSSAPANVEVDFGETASHVELYDPSVSAAPLASHRGVRKLGVAVPDHPLLLEVTLAGAPRS